MVTNRVCSEARRWRVVLLAVIAIALVFSSLERPRASASGLVISQVYGGGGNSGAPYRNDFIELFNGGSQTVSLSGLSIQYASATGTGNFGANSGQMTELPAVSLPPGQHYLVQEASGTAGVPLPAPDYVDTTPINLSGSAGKVALVDNAVSLGCNGGSTPCIATQVAHIVDLVGYGNANFYEGSGAAPTLSNTTAALRNAGGYTDTDNNAADFSSGAPNPRNAGISGTGSAVPASAAPGGTVLFTVTVIAPATSTQIVVRGDFSTIGGSTAQVFSAGNNGTTFSYLATVGGTIAPGSKLLPVTISDAQSRSAAVTITFAVEPPQVTPIHDIQGQGSTSPFAAQLIVTTGIVTGVKTSGFFIQAPDNENDADPNTSEGVFVYTNSVPPSSVVVASAVRVVGTVQEYVPSTDPYSPSMTEILPVAITVTGTGTLPAPIALTAADTNPTGGLEQMERYEGMRVTVESLTVIAPTSGSVSEANATSTSNGVFYGVITGVSRPFREPGVQRPDALLPGAPSGTPRFDGNPERLRVDSDAIGGAGLDVATGDYVANLTGPLDYGYRTYTIDPEPASNPTVTGDLKALAVPVPGGGQFTIATFNMERFFDTTNDPDTSDAVLTAAGFDVRLAKASLIIRNMMRMPEIIGVEEVENLATLQAVAAKIDADAIAAGQTSPNYVAYLEEGNDIGGIDVGFLVKGTVHVTESVQVGKNAKFTDPKDGSLDNLNDRPPFVLRADVPDPRGGPSFTVTLIANHLRSLNDVDADTPDGKYARAKRQLQAEFLANLIQQYQLAGERVVSVGDYNAFQFNDGYVDVMGTIVGVPAPADQVLLANADLVDPNLTDLVDFAPPHQKYSYILDGTAQALDHILVSSNMQTRVASVAFARCNADFPESLRGDGTRPERLSDHDPMVAYFTFPTADLAVAVSGAPNPVQSGSTVTYTIPVTNTATDPAVNPVVTDTLPAGMTFGTASGDGWACSASGNTITCTASVLAAESTATITVSGVLDCGLPNGAVLTNHVALTATTLDPDQSNNNAAFETTVSNPAPVITVNPASPSTLWPVTHKMVEVAVDYDVTDNCGVPSCSLKVTSNEPVNGTGDGNTAADWSVVDAHHVQLRAERSGNGPGRIYTIAVTCADANGNNSTQTTTVTVPKSQK